jgi:RNA polymerase sigma-70 factor (ECF subfamily)
MPVYIRLAAGCQRQDRQAFGELYTLYVQRVFGYLYSRIGNVAEVEDVTAQTFLAALEAFTRYQHDGYFAAWLFSIARHKCMDHFRQQHQQVPLEDAQQVAAETDLLQQLIQTEQVAALVAQIASLPEAERDLIRLRYVAELSYGLYVANLDGTGKHLVASVGLTAVWSPDGERLLVSGFEQSSGSTAAEWQGFVVQPATCQVSRLSAVDGEVTGWR